MHLCLMPLITCTLLPWLPALSVLEWNYCTCCHCDQLHLCIWWNTCTCCHGYQLHLLTVIQDTVSTHCHSYHFAFVKYVVTVSCHNYKDVYVTVKGFSGKEYCDILCQCWTCMWRMITLYKYRTLHTSGRRWSSWCQSATQRCNRRWSDSRTMSVCVASLHRRPTWWASG